MADPEVPSIQSLHNSDIDHLRRAIAFACFAHNGQVDKVGEPYIWHCLRVGISLLPDVDAAIVGVLHDVLEDTEFGAESLRPLVSEECFEALLELYRETGKAYEDYIRQVALNPLALKVKVADLTDNSRADRLNKLAPEVRNQLRNKYANALNILWLAENTNSKGETPNVL